VRPDVADVSRADVFLDEFPVLAVQLERVQESLVLFVGPPALLLCHLLLPLLIFNWTLPMEQSVYIDWGKVFLDIMLMDWVLQLEPTPGFLLTQVLLEGVDEEVGLLVEVNDLYPISSL